VPLAGKSPNQVSPFQCVDEGHDRTRVAARTRQQSSSGKSIPASRAEVEDDFEPACSQCVNQIAAAIALSEP